MYGRSQLIKVAGISSRLSGSSQWDRGLMLLSLQLRAGLGASPTERIVDEGARIGLIVRKVVVQCYASMPLTKGPPRVIAYWQRL
jgi:hypothetical protein